MIRKLSFLVVFWTTFVSTFCQSSLENEKLKIDLDNKGRITKWMNKTTGDSISFLRGKYAGPNFYGFWDKAQRTVSLEQQSKNRFEGKEADLSFCLEYRFEKGVLAIIASIKNSGYTPIQPQKIGLNLGLNTVMEKYPDWNHKFFPTYSRCEKTHFTGYAMAPDGRILCVASPDPIASWSNDFTLSWGAPEYKWHGHRILSWNLDLLNTLPLPERHPQHLYQIKKGEEIHWTIYLSPLKDLKKVPGELARLTNAPFIEIEETTIPQNGKTKVKVIGGQPHQMVKIKSPNGQIQTKELSQKSDFEFNATNETGIYTITVEGENHKSSQGLITVRKPWNWYMKNARLAALKYPARATTHCETWYGLYTLYLSEKYWADTDLLAKTEERFQNIFPQLYDTEKLVPTKIPHRIQNTSSMIGVLVDRYQATGNIESLEKASKLADWIMNHAQAKDGSYRAGKTHYTSVIYPGKSLMELFLVEKELGKKDKKWKQAYKRHYTSVKAAMDELERSGDNIDTEGELTYEDGMISCSALQLGLFALIQDNKKEQEKYKKAALKLLRGHRCLSQLLIPDSRQRGGTLRYWESQYDVYIHPNMFNSPHGWTSWKTYATYYAYLLTGKEEWLRQTLNALGSSVQMIDTQTGTLRWAFVPNPYVPVIQTSQPHMEGNIDKYNPGHYHPKKYPHREYVIGEQYVDMISDWIRVNSQDNDVHEHFKCLEEVALSNAFVVEREDGTLVGYNCQVSKNNGVIEIRPSEGQIQKVHFNIKYKTKARVLFASRKTEIKVGPMEWIELK